MSNVGGIFVTYDVTSTNTVDGVDMSKVISGGYKDSGQLSAQPPSSVGIYISHAFHTNKLLCSIPFVYDTSRFVVDLGGVRSYFSGVADKKIEVVWTIENFTTAASTITGGFLS